MKLLISICIICSTFPIIPKTYQEISSSYNGIRSNHIFNHTVISSLKINTNSYSKIVSYPNPPSTNDIIEEYIKLNYPLNKIDRYEVVLDEYKQAVLLHDYGNHEIIANLYNKNNDQEEISINVNIIDNEAPFIKNGDYIKISYTELDQGGFIDLTKYISIFDYTDGIIKLDSKYQNYKPELFKKNKLSFTLEDSLHNKATYDIQLEIIDDVPPVIKGPTYIELYQYEITKKEELLDYFTIDDLNGSGIKETKIISNDNSFLNSIGLKEFELVAYDYYLNATHYPFTLQILDGVGDVYFKNLESIEVYQGDLKSASEIVNKLIKENKLDNDIFEDIQFITTTYCSSYDQIGTYETRMVLTRYNSKKLYISFQINVISKPNAFIQFFIDFFNKIIEFFQKLFNL
jgi:hypothetical protein